MWTGPQGSSLGDAGDVGAEAVLYALSRDYWARALPRNWRSRSESRSDLRSWHSHTTIARQPSVERARRTRLSRALF